MGVYGRYSYIVNATGSIRNSRLSVTVHGLFFHFGRVERNLNRIKFVKDMVLKVVYEHAEYQNTIIKTLAESDEECDSAMSLGLGFYRLQILVNNIPQGKSIDIRRGFKK